MLVPRSDGAKRRRFARVLPIRKVPAADRSAASGMRKLTGVWPVMKDSRPAGTADRPGQQTDQDGWSAGTA
jgi:hypothetical protein